MSDRPSPSASIQNLVQTVHRLRAPDGCPWDREQTHRSLRPYLIEEAYEVLAVLDRIAKPEDLDEPQVRADFKEELGDLLMQVVLHAEMTREAGAFDFYDVAEGLNAKLIRRHPHVFGETKASSSEQALRNWEKEKSKEKASKPDQSVLDGLPAALPALQRSHRLIEKVTKVGFQWPDWRGPLAKAKEELRELEEAIESGDRAHMEAELGDLLFSVANLAFSVKIQPEDALRAQLKRFEKRFRFVERQVKLSGRKLDETPLEVMDRHWDQSKLLEKIDVIGLTGGIGAGKSAVADRLRALGYVVIDADAVARALSSEGGKAAPAVQALFGTLDRAEIRKAILADAGKKARLEALLHPLIAESLHDEIRRLIQDPAFQKAKRPIFYEAALLVETGRYQDFWKLVTVEAEEDIRIKRVVKNRALSETEARAVIRNQTSREARVAVADCAIENSGDLEHLDAEIDRALKTLQIEA